MGRILDRKKLYGDVLGEAPNGARYQQDGIDFNGQGHEICSGEEPVALEPKPIIDEEPEPINVEGRPEPGVVEPVYTMDLEEISPSVEIVEPKIMDRAPRIKNWTKKAVLNHMRMRFPEVEIDDNWQPSDAKGKLRALYADIPET